jgi:diguanylate cyclase (GGDEF)-like protein
MKIVAFIEQPPLIERSYDTASYGRKVPGRHLILPECSSDAACQLAERLRTRVNQHSIPIAGQNITATVSTGVVELCTNDISFEHFVRRADHALYRGKVRGRNQVIFEPALSPGEGTAA